VAILPSIIGRKTYSFLRNLTSPNLPKDTSFKALTDKLKEHFEPKKVIIVERFSFYCWNQDPSETITAYVAELRRLASTCVFENYLSTALRDKFVCGVHSESMQR